MFRTLARNVFEGCLTSINTAIFREKQARPTVAVIAA